MAEYNPITDFARVMYESGRAGAFFDEQLAAQDEVIDAQARVVAAARDPMEDLHSAPDGGIFYEDEDPE